MAFSHSTGSREPNRWRGQFAGGLALEKGVGISAFLIGDLWQNSHRSISGWGARQNIHMARTITG